MLITGKVGRMKWRFALTLIFFLFVAHMCIHAQKNKRCYQTRMYKAFRSLGEVIEDAILLHVKLFTVDSVKIITAFTPFYLSARMIDEDVQQNFHDRECHVNINQFPQKCHEIAQKGVGVPMVFLSSLALWAPKENLRMTARMFAIGLPFVHSGKDIIKKLDNNICLRPWHENFSHHKRSTGGFPSGHMANVTYMTALFGMRHGWRWAVPLSLFAAFVFADFLNCNRHYLSQLVAGVGFGLIYAFAAQKVIERRMNQRMWFDMWCNDQAAGISVGCTF